MENSLYLRAKWNNISCVYVNISSSSGTLRFAAAQWLPSSTWISENFSVLLVSLIVYNVWRHWYCSSSSMPVRHTKARYTLPVRTGRLNGPFERPVQTGAFLAPVRTGRSNGPFKRVVCTGPFGEKHCLQCFFVERAVKPDTHYPFERPVRTGSVYRA